jgi:glycine cleavage system pyridoxal-binding protein P
MAGMHTVGPKGLQYIADKSSCFRQSATKRIEKISFIPNKHQVYFDTIVIKPMLKN